MIINLTPHELNVYDADGNWKFNLAPTYPPARVEEDRGQIGEVAGVPIWFTSFGEVEDLPEPEEDTIYIVSRMVKDRVPLRDDVLCPGTAIREGSGKIVGCIGFSA